MAGRGFRPPPRIEKVAPLPLAGGGAGANRLDLDPSQFRDATVRDRRTRNTLTVAEDLANTIGNLDTTTGKDGTHKPPLSLFTENLQQAFLEHQKNPVEGNLTPYREAFQSLLQKNPGKAADVLTAIKGVVDTRNPRDPELGANLVGALAFNDADAEAPPSVTSRIESLTPDQRQEMMRAQDLQSALETGRQIASQQEVAPNEVEGMQQVPLAEEAVAFDDTAQGSALAREIARIERQNPILQGLIRNNPSAAPAPQGPAAAMDRGDYDLSLSQLLGDSQRAESYYFRDQVRPSRQLFPLMRQENVIRTLADLSGKDFFPALPAESSTVGKLNRDPNPDSPTMSEGAEGSIGPYYDFGVASVGNKKQWAASEYPQLAEALGIVDESLLANPKYDPANPDAINPDTGRPYTQFVIPAAREKDVLGLLSQEGVPQGGRVIMRYGTSASNNPALDRSIRAEDRGALTKLREQAIRTIEGEASGVPDVLAGLMDSKKIRATRTRKTGTGWESYDDPVATMTPEARAAAAETLQRAVNQGGILPMHALAPWSTARYVMQMPDGNKLYFKLRPEHVSRLMAQTMLIDNPETIQSMTPAVQRSMEVYDQIDATGRARDFLDESGEPQYIQPTQKFLKALFDLNQNEGVPLPEMYPMPEDVPMESMMPNPQAIMGPDLSGQTSAMAPRFQQEQFLRNPVASLIG